MSKIVIEDFSGTICDPKWRNVPMNELQASGILKGKRCLVCNSPLLLALVRPPVNVWKCHCNNCGSEIPIAVLINRKAWKV